MEQWFGHVHATLAGNGHLADLLNLIDTVCIVHARDTSINA